MALSLNHFSIRTLDMAATEAFYSKVLGLTAGPRPPFPFPGFWMYAGSHDNYANAVVHIIGMDKNDPEGLKKYLGFFATGLEGMLKHLKTLGVAFRERTVPSIGLHQLFLDDPTGIVIELNYPEAESAALQAKSKAATA
jgi:catechol 2,3-dioxygenase-like lactoylglutathione lyase family enzyme